MTTLIRLNKPPRRLARDHGTLGWPKVMLFAGLVLSCVICLACGSGAQEAREPGTSQHVVSGDKASKGSAFGSFEQGALSGPKKKKPANHDVEVPPAP